MNCLAPIEETLRRLPEQQPPAGLLDRLLADAHAQKHVRPDTARPAGIVSVLTGEGEIRDLRTQVSYPAMQGARLPRESALRLLEGCGLVHMEDGSDVWIAAGAEVDFMPWNAERRGLRLATGRVLALIAPGQSRPFQLLAAAAQIHVTGTAFQAIASARGLDVAILHGRVVCHAGSSETRIRRGYRVSVPPGGKPEVTRCRPDELDLDPPLLLGASAKNPAIRAACRAVARSLYPEEYKSKGFRTMTGTNHPSRKWLLLLIVMLGVAAVIWWRPPLSSTGATTTPLAQTASPAGVDAKEHGASAASSSPSAEEHHAATEKEVHRIAIKIDAQGNYIPDPADANSAANPKMGTEAAGRKKARAILGLVNDMVRTGVPRGEATSRVERGIQESMGLRARAEGRTPPQFRLHSTENSFEVEVVQPGMSQNAK